MKSSLNAVEMAVTDYAVFNFSGTSTLPKDTVTGPNGEVPIYEEADKTEQTLKIELLNSVHIAHCYDMEDGQLTHNLASLGDLFALSNSLTANTFDTVAYDEAHDEVINDDDDDDDEDEDEEDEDDEEEDDEELEEEDDDEDEDEDDEEMHHPISPSIYAASLGALVDVLHQTHHSEKDGYKISNPTKCKHRIHIFEMHSPGIHNTYTYFGLLVRRDDETGETALSLIITDPLAIVMKNGKLTLLNDPTSNFDVDETYARLLLSLLGFVLPKAVVDALKFDNLLVGYTDVDSEDSVIENLYAGLLNHRSALSKHTEYSPKDGMSLLLARKLIQDSGDDTEDDAYYIGSVIRPADGFNLNSLDDIEKSVGTDLFQAAAAELNVSLERKVLQVH